MKATLNMQLKSLPAVVRTWQPVTATAAARLAYATQAPERPSRLTGCYVAHQRRQSPHRSSSCDRSLTGDRSIYE